MRQRKWGRIINLSSVAAQTGGAVGAHYAASKAGIIGLTHSGAASLIRDGITVNVIAPALIETDMVTSNPKTSRLHQQFSVSEMAGYINHLRRAGISDTADLCSCLLRRTRS